MSIGWDEIHAHTRNARTYSLKLGVVGNCQGYIVADYIRHANQHIDVSSLISGSGRKPLLKEDIEAFCARQDVVLIMDPYDPAALSLGHSHIYEFPSLFFRPGLHPDVTAISSAHNTLIPSPVGGLHSIIAVESFLRGYTVEETTKKFNSKTFATLSYFFCVQNTINGLARRFAKCGLNIADFMPKFFRNAPFMYWGLHACPGVIADVAAAILQKHGIPIQHKNIQHYLSNKILDNGVWPIYPEIACACGLDSWGSYLFTYKGVCYDLPLFVDASFFIYDKVDLGNSTFKRRDI